MEDSLLEEIESFERESRSPQRAVADVCEVNENDEFDTFHNTLFFTDILRSSYLSVPE